MKPYALVLLGALLPAACRSTPEAGPSTTGYRGIEKLTTLTKGME